MKYKIGDEVFYKKVVIVLDEKDTYESNVLVEKSGLLEDKKKFIRSISKYQHEKVVMHGYIRGIMEGNISNKAIINDNEVYFENIIMKTNE